MTADQTYRVDRDELLARVSLTQVLDSLTAGVGDAHRRRWRCPESSHPDEHPSVTVARDRHGTERWRCWSGGHGGTAIDAVIAARQLGIGESIGWLNDHHAHLQPLSVDAVLTTRRPVGEPSPHAIEYVERCEQMLRTRSGSEIRSWLGERGLDDDVLALNRVGADPGRRLLPRRRGLPPGHPAAVFPALDRSGNITYFQARFLDPNRVGQKYGNPIGQLATNPRLAWSQPVGVVDPDLPLVLTEGIPDSLIAARAGMKSVALLGSTVSAHQIAIEMNHALDDAEAPSRIAVCFDADDAGRTAAAQLIEHFDVQGINVVNVDPPDGMDITDWALADVNWQEQLLDATITTPVALRAVASTPPERTTEIEIDLGP